MFLASFVLQFIVFFFTVDLWPLKHKAFQAYVVYHVTTEGTLLLTQTILRVIAVSWTYRIPNMDNSKRHQDRCCTKKLTGTLTCNPLFFINYKQTQGVVTVLQ